MNHLLLYLLIRNIAAAVADSQVRCLRLLPPVLTIELGHRSQTSYLVVILSTPGPFLFFDTVDPLGGMGTPVLKRIHGQRVERAPESPLDRVIALPLAREEEATALALYLYGSSAKVRILGREHIVESLDPRDAGLPVPDVRAPQVPPFVAISVAELCRALDQEGEASRPVPGLDRQLAACFTAEDGVVDVDALLVFRDALLDGRTEFYLGTDARIGRATPIPSSCQHIQHLAHRWGPFGTVQEACAAVGRILIGTAQQTILERYRALVRKHLDNRKRLLHKLEAELSRAQTHTMGRNEADVLAAFQSQVPAGASEVELPDLYSAGNVRKIKLDPSLPVSEQIQRRYKRAAKLERSRDILARRVRETAKEISGLVEDLVERNATFAQALGRLQAAVQEHHLGKQICRNVLREAATTKQYRRFDLNQGWFVLVGRNDKENDEITFRLSGPEDIWLHAQNVAGSHVVLRPSGSAGNPPRSVLEAAAEIAAFYSKAHHSNLVPVIYTRRKYVRKFRGAKPGQVRCEREKTIFAEPKLPAT
ncbi:MAG: NFACT RNA binding domain-containing protein [Candidatus Krumholzibacteria bacterium]|nr:NFACT RNA binding domain-containing protein [Candidatus Krumholzibacteria bacterium]